MNKKFDHGPLWAEVNLDNLIHNIKAIRSIINEETRLMGVIKANAYGHGAVKFAKVLLENGADALAVATIREAIELRESGINSDILILGYTQDSDLELALKYDLIQTVYSLRQARILSEIASAEDKKIRIHIKIDTGMSRIGYRTLDEVDEIVEISKLKGLEIDGAFTHFATADSLDKSFTKEQYGRYETMLMELEKKGLKIPNKHVSNSAAIMDLPEYNLDMVRAGIIIYGLYPSNEVKKENLDLRPVMTLKTKISHIKTVEDGTGIGYGQTHIVKGQAKVGTIPIGYADGYSRLLSNQAEVFVGSRRAGIIGRVCMDQTMIDLSGIEDVKVEDEVILFGDGSLGEPTIDELAAKVETINYELATLVGRRIPRVYYMDGEIVDIVDYVLD